MTPEQLQQVEAAKAALPNATPGPWLMRRDSCHFSTMTEVYNGDGIIAEANLECDIPLLAAAPVLVERVMELEAELKRYEWALAETEALVMSHEGHISRQDALIQRLKEWQERAVEEGLIYYKKFVGSDRLIRLSRLITEAQGGQPNIGTCKTLGEIKQIAGLRAAIMATEEGEK